MAGELCDLPGHRARARPLAADPFAIRSPTKEKTCRGSRAGLGLGDRLFIMKLTLILSLCLLTLVGCDSASDSTASVPQASESTAAIAPSQPSANVLATPTAMGMAASQAPDSTCTASCCSSATKAVSQAVPAALPIAPNGACTAACCSSVTKAATPAMPVAPMPGECCAPGTCVSEGCCSSKATTPAPAGRP